jgi:hypothetical protein
LKKYVACLAVFMLTLVLLSTVAVAEMKLVVKHELNFNNTLDYNHWNLLTVTVMNDGTEDWQGTVTVSMAGAYEKEVFIPAGKTVDVIFYLAPVGIQNFFGGEETIQIQLRGKDGGVVSTNRVNVSPTLGTSTIGVLSDTPEQLNVLTILFSANKLVGVQEKHLEHLLFMNQFSMLIISDGQVMTLKQEHKDHLLRWVEGGGILVVGGGQGWQMNAAQVPEELLPFKPTGMAEISGDSLPIDGVDPTGRFLVSTGTVNGDVLLSAGSQPLLLSRDFGRGMVFYSTLNLEGAPLTDATALEDYWGVIFSTGGGRVNTSTSGYEKMYVSELLNVITMDTSNTIIFSPAKISFGFLFYILLVGPASFLVLRRMRRWEWGWVTIPTIAVLFTAMIYLMAGSGRSSDYSMYQINFIDIHHENRAIAESYGALFIPERGSVSFDSTVSTLAPGRGMVLEKHASDDTNTIRIDNPPLWSTQRLYAMEPLELDGTIKVTATIKEHTIEATISNDSAYPLFLSYLRIGNSWQLVGSLDPGETKNLLATGTGMLDFSQVLQHYTTNSRYMQYWPEEIFNYPSDLLFVGFNDDLSILNLEGVEQAHTVNIFVTGADVKDLTLEDSFNIREGWVRPFVISQQSMSSGSGHYYPGYYPGHYPGQDGQLNLSGSGELDLVFGLPEGIDYAQGIYRMRIHVEGNGSAEASVYNSSQKMYESLDTLNFGSSNSFDLNNIEELVRDDQLIIRLKYQGDMWCDTRSMLSVQGGVAK